MDLRDVGSIAIPYRSQGWVPREHNSGGTVTIVFFTSVRKFKDENQLNPKSQSANNTAHTSPRADDLHYVTQETKLAVAPDGALFATDVTSYEPQNHFAQ